MRTLRTAYAAILLLVTGVAIPSQAADAQGQSPSEFIEAVAQIAIQAANNKSISLVERQRIFEELLNTKFDIPQIASFVLGQYWQMANDVDRETFTEAFRNYVLRSYSSRFFGYAGESLRVLGHRASNTNGTVVYTEIGEQGAGTALKLEWRVVDRGGYKIIDLSVSGISMAITKREEFASVLRRNGGDLPSLTRQLDIVATAQSSK